MIKIKLKIPIYETELWVVLCRDIYKDSQFLKKCLRSDDPTDADHKAVTYGVEGCYSILFDEREFNHAVLTHEVGHVSRAIMRDIGFAIHTDNDEPLAYLEEYIIKEVTKAIKKHKKKETNN